MATEMFSSTNCHGGVTECLYQSIYGDGSTIEGYFVEDLFTYDQLVGNTSTPRNGSASVVFGYSTSLHMFNISSPVWVWFVAKSKYIYVPEDLLSKNMVEQHVLIHME
jgi:hypothetical protein